jgi:hypothetical protein
MTAEADGRQVARQPTGRDSASPGAVFEIAPRCRSGENEPGA